MPGLLVVLAHPDDESRDMACELPEWFRIPLTANDDMVERALQGFKRAMKATLSATV